MSATTQRTGSPTVLTEQAGGVFTIRLNRPEKLNALDPETCRALVHALLRAADEKSVHVIMITGQGRAFCAGGDLNRIGDMRNRRAVAEFQSMLVSGKELCLAIASMPKLVVAAVNGPAAGAGMSI